MNEPLGVSVIIVNWNTRDLVLRLLGRLQDDDCVLTRQLQMIVVDNGSMDGSVEAIRFEYPQTTVLSQEQNRGYAGAINPGIAKAIQPLIFVLNSDLQTDCISIERVAQYAEEQQQAGIIGPQIQNDDGSHQSSSWRDPSLLWIFLESLGLSRLRPLNLERYGGRPRRTPAIVDCVCGCAMLIRRDVLMELGGFDEDFFMYYEETDLCRRVRQSGRQVHHVPIGLFLHEGGGTSRAVRLRTFLDYHRSHILYYTKYSGTTAAVAARVLLAVGMAIRVPPLAILYVLGRKRRVRIAEKLMLNWRGLRWLLNPAGGLVPDVDRET